MMQPAEGQSASPAERAPSSDPAGSAANPLPDPADSQPAVAETIVEQVDEVTGRFERFADDPGLDSALNILGPLLFDLALALGGLIVLVLAVSFFGRWVQRGMNAALQRSQVESTVAKFLARLTKYGLWLIALPIAFGLFGIRTTSLAAVIGAAGLAIGLAMQGSLSNIAAGVMLLLLRPIRIGDLVELQDETGEVKDIGIFYTTVNTFANRVVSIPNGEVLSGKIESLTGNRTRRVEIAVGVAYGTDLAEARKVLKEAVDQVESRSDEHDPAVWLTGFGDSSIDFEVHVWCPSRECLTVRNDAIEAIDRALADADIEMPFPQRTLHLAQAEYLGERLGAMAETETA